MKRVRIIRRGYILVHTVFVISSFLLVPHFPVLLRKCFVNDWKSPMYNPNVEIKLISNHRKAVVIVHATNDKDSSIIKKEFIEAWIKIPVIFSCGGTRICRYKRNLLELLLQTTDPRKKISECSPTDPNTCILPSRLKSSRAWSIDLLTEVKSELRGPRVFRQSAALAVGGHVEIWGLGLGSWPLSTICVLYPG